MVPSPRGVIAATAARIARSAEKKLSSSEAWKSASLTFDEAVEAQLHAADIVDQHVEPAVLLDGVVDEPGRALGVEEVDREGLDALEALQGRDVRAPATTSAPSAASSRATARPMPLLAPVTTATLPDSSRSMGGRYRPTSSRLSTSSVTASGAWSAAIATSSPRSR